MGEPIISVSGLRGIVGEELTPDVATRYAGAFAATLPEGSVLVTRDGRASGQMLARLVCGALQAAGRDVIYADVAATPTTGVLVRHHACAGGIQISASHNPPAYNGLKLFSCDGRVIPSGDGEVVLQRYRTQTDDWVKAAEVGAFSELDETTATHSELVLNTVSVDRIRERHFKVVLDSNHGAGSRLGAVILNALGCQTVLLGGRPDGQFAHPPEPTAENLAGVCESIVNAKADVGFCQDPDADRLAVIDADGRYIGEEYTLALCLDHVLSSRRGAVVTNCSTSRMAEDLAAKHGAPFFRSAVGEANVVDTMLANEAVFGGEGNGGPIDPQVGLVRDSFVGMALILDSMAQSENTVAELVSALPSYSIHKTKVSLDRDKIPAALDALESHFSDARADRLDGLRLDWQDRWLLVRASNTEPIVRLIAEANSASDARELCVQAHEVLGSI